MSRFSRGSVASSQRTSSVAARTFRFVMLTNNRRRDQSGGSSISSLADGVDQARRGSNTSLIRLRALALCCPTVARKCARHRKLPRRIMAQERRQQNKDRSPVRCVSDRQGEYPNNEISLVRAVMQVESPAIDRRDEGTGQRYGASGLSSYYGRM